LDGDKSLYDKHIQPLVYAIAILLPISYIIGVVFTLRTHTSYVYDEFYDEVAKDGGHGREYYFCHFDLKDMKQRKETPFKFQLFDWLILNLLIVLISKLKFLIWF
jgi:Ca2+/H+ antiporter